MNIREEHLPITRSARVCYLGEADKADELWLACHGYGQLAARFIRNFESIAAPQRLIVAPEGLHRFYLDPPPTPARQRRVGATWMTREDRETDIRDYIAYLDGVLAHVQTNRRPLKRITVLGFSQGASTAFRWAVLGAARIHKLILWGGEVPPDVDMTNAKARLADVQVIVVRGRADSYASEQAVQAQLQRLAESDIAASVREFDGEHELDSTLLGQLASES